MIFRYNSPSTTAGQYRVTTIPRYTTPAPPTGGYSTTSRPYIGSTEENVYVSSSQRPAYDNSRELSGAIVSNQGEYGLKNYQETSGFR
jgi:hypothetical protein